MHCFVPLGPDAVLGLFFSATFGLYSVCLYDVEEVVLRGGRCSVPPLVSMGSFRRARYTPGRFCGCKCHGPFGVVCTVAGGEGRRWPDRQAGLLCGRFSTLGRILAHPHSPLFCHVNPRASSPGLVRSLHPLVLRVLPRVAARPLVRPQAGRGPGLPGRHTGRARPVRPPIAPPVTSPQRLSAVAGTIIARLCSSSTGPFSFLLIRSYSDLIGGPGLHRLILDTSPESAFGFQLCYRPRYVSDFNFTAGPVGSSPSMRPPS
ncbi:hypothetical protein NDU88_003265 [Pleurodeles waltl]|uniref:Uncharacterized protein n=1 Tax=Pleurodeles waltl TaxID=8319 RepID=A0AAV7TN05_PLEWA|nr:hypothetical protein NDU88_003265 [Pleurodeles waltl]